LNDQIEHAVRIMESFARDTGLSDPTQTPRRYLWTDAFAVCNFFQLAKSSGDEHYRTLALALIDQVHDVLGRHHPDSDRQGWLSGLDNGEARQHPTIAGLRIGKKLNERGIGEPFDEQREWDRDGQYFHYLTKWMHALNVAFEETGNPDSLRWAVELAHTAFAAFSYSVGPAQPKRMYWKMSVDLSRPLVPSMGQHDPLDGLLTFLELECNRSEAEDAGLTLASEIAALELMCAGQSWATTDALGIGGLLADTWKYLQIRQRGVSTDALSVARLIDDITWSVQQLLRENSLALPAEYRLAFRELGLAIGLQAIDRVFHAVAAHPEYVPKADQADKQRDFLMRIAPLHTDIEAFWLASGNQRAASWREHLDINRVMLASSLVPDRLLMI